MPIGYQIKCPHCEDTDTYYSTNEQNWKCHSCSETFALTDSSTNKGIKITRINTLSKVKEPSGNSNHTWDDTRKRIHSIKMKWKWNTATENEVEEYFQLTNTRLTSQA